jgi:hypothetical protein
MDLGPSAIKWPARLRQVIDFRGLNFGGSRPIDGDGFHWFPDGVHFAMLEFKCMGAELGEGQRIQLTRTVDAINHSGCIARLFVVDHDVRDPRDPVIAYTTIVRYTYAHGRWELPRVSTTLVDALTVFSGVRPRPWRPIEPVQLKLF